MKIRDGFVTNSSSTNFIIISKDMLTKDFLFKKLGFIKGSPIESLGKELCANILHGTNYPICDPKDYSEIKKIFGKETLKKIKEQEKQGWFVYIGRTDSETDYLTSIFTTDSFEIDEDDFYINGINCLW